MKQIFFAAIALLFVSCKKDSNPAPLHANNQVNAIVILSSGDTIKINGTGSKAVMGCSLLGGGTFVAGTDAFNRAIYTTIYDSNLSCVTSPGTYNFSCQYRPDVSSQNTPIYLHSFASNRGSITFTVLNGNQAEGYFHAVCKYGTDSVFVQGTFKGYMP